MNCHHICDKLTNTNVVLIKQAWRVYQVTAAGWALQPSSPAPELIKSMHLHRALKPEGVTDIRNKMLHKGKGLSHMTLIWVKRKGETKAAGEGGYGFKWSKGRNGGQKRGHWTWVPWMSSGFCECHHEIIHHHPSMQTFMNKLDLSALRQ